MRGRSKILLVVGLIGIAGGMAYWSQTFVAKVGLRTYFFLKAGVKAEVGECRLQLLPPSLKVVSLSLQSLHQVDPWTVTLPWLQLRWGWPGRDGIPWTLQARLKDGYMTGTGFLDLAHWVAQVDLWVVDFPMVQLNPWILEDWGIGFRRGLATVHTTGTVDGQGPNLTNRVTLSSVKHFEVQPEKMPEFYRRSLRMAGMMRQPFSFSFPLRGPWDHLSLASTLPSGLPKSLRFRSYSTPDS